MNKRILWLSTLAVTLGITQIDAAWVNDPAPAFDLSTVDGKSAAFPSSKPAVTVINFWASWCPPCKIEFPKLNQLAGEYAGKNVRVVAITVDKAAANVKTFLDAAGGGPFQAEILRDPDGKTARAYAAKAMPMSFIVDPKGVIRYAHMGFQANDEKKWRQEIDTILGDADKKP